MVGTSKAAILLGCLALGGCLGDGFVDQFALSSPTPQPAVDDVVGTGRSVATLPWQLTPASTGSRSQGEVTYVETVPSLGPVRGTKVALAYLDRRIVAYEAPRQAVDACEKLLAPQAIKQGAYSVEAAPAGPVKSLKGGDKSQQVFFRIMYRTSEGVEVRQHSLDCRVTKDYRVVGASPV